MSLMLMQKNLAHAHQVLSACMVSLRTSNKPSQIALTINGATAAATADLRSAPKQSVAVVTDLADARVALDTVTKRLTNLGKVVATRKIAFPDYRAERDALSTMLEAAELQLNASKTLIAKAAKVEKVADADTALTTPAFFIALLDTQSVADLHALTRRWVAGLSRSEVDQLSRRRGELVDSLMNATDSTTARTVLSVVSDMMLNKADDNAARTDMESTVRAAQAIEIVRKLETKFGADLAKVNVKTGGLAQVRLPLRVTFAHRQIRPDTLARNGMKSMPYTYDKFSNGTFVVEDQALVVFRKSDAETYHREAQNESRKSSSDIVMLKNLNSRLKKVNVEIAELKASAATQRSARARQAIEEQVTELTAQVDTIQKSITTVQSGADAAKKLISNRHKLAKKSSDEMVRSYADYLLDQINDRMSIEYAKVSGKLLHKVKNTDYVYMWIAPKHYVRALHALSGGNGDLVTNWTIAWM